VKHFPPPGFEADIRFKFLFETIFLFWGIYANFRRHRATSGRSGRICVVIYIYSININTLFFPFIDNLAVDNPLKKADCRVSGEINRPFPGKSDKPALHPPQAGEPYLRG
jgi:hypothetical protein